MHLVGFIIRFYHDARLPEHQNKIIRKLENKDSNIEPSFEVTEPQEIKPSVILLSDRHNSYILVDFAYLVFSRYCCMFRLSTLVLIREGIGSQKEIKKRGQAPPYNSGCKDHRRS